jgi:hypothetical protein
MRVNDHSQLKPQPTRRFAVGRAIGYTVLKATGVPVGTIGTPATKRRPEIPMAISAPTHRPIDFRIYEWSTN